MGLLSDDYGNAALNALTSGGVTDPPATRYFGLRYNGVEVSAGGSAYARVPITTSGWWTTATFEEASFARTNVSSVSFATPTAPWGYVNELCLYDGAMDTVPAIVFTLTDDGGAALYIENGAALLILPGEIILYLYTGNS